MKINEVAKLTGITVRTLHYYDEIGLLKPSVVTEVGYRIYEKEDLEVLQQILFFRELDFSLKDIKDIMTNLNYDKNEALKRHKEMLLEKKKHLENLIDLVEKTMKGEKNMSFKEFDTTEIEESKKKFAEEVKQRWGNTEAYKESEEKTSAYDKAKWQALNDEGTEILKEFAENRQLPPDSEKVQKLVKKWQNYITKNFYKCTDEILAGLGIMYSQDKRFTENIDRNGTGTVEFMSKAIEIYVRECK